MNSARLNCGAVLIAIMALAFVNPMTAASIARGDWHTTSAPVTIAGQGEADTSVALRQPKSMRSDVGIMMPQPAAGLLISGGLAFLIVFAILRVRRIGRRR
jgi:hypothetical protein